jgi:uncharacterized membrane protein YfcA
MALILVLTFSAAAFAGGPPPKNLKKGDFLEVYPMTRTALFKDVATDKEIILTISDAVDLEDVVLNKRVMVMMDESGAGDVVNSVSVMFLDLTMTRFIALIVVGLVGGLLSGFIGSGGAFVLTPAMMSLGIPGAVAVASNMCHKFPKAMVGAYKRFKYGQVDLKLGVFMAVSAIVGVQIGIHIQKAIMNAWGNAGSNLYVSVVFVIVLVVVGGYVFRDAQKIGKGETVEETGAFALKMQKIKLAPMIHFKTAGITISAWITIPIGLATGMLAATIAVGGFVGVPGMIYVFGASALIASATELVVAFIMGTYGSIQWAMSGLIDIRVTLLILSASLIGVQLGALGTTYVKDYTIKIVMGSVMLIVAISRGAKIPVYLDQLGFMTVNGGTASILNSISFWSLIAALGTAGFIITGAMIKGMSQAKKEELQAATSHGKV